MDSLKEDVSLPSSMFGTRGLVKFFRFYEENSALYLAWSRLAAKISVSGIMDLLEDIATYVKREMRLNTLGMAFLFLSIYRIILLRLNPEMWRFPYSGIRR